MSQPISQHEKIRKLTIGGILIAFSLFLGFTGWGFIPLPLPIQGATIFHIPVIIAGIILGPLYGFIVGCVFGAFAVFQFPTFPWFVLLPARPMIGLVAGFVFLAFNKINKTGVMVLLSSAIAAILGSLTNSIITLGLGTIFRVFGPALATNIAVVISSIPVVILEAFLAAYIVPAIVTAWMIYNKEYNLKTIHGFRSIGFSTLIGTVLGLFIGYLTRPSFPDTGKLSLSSIIKSAFNSDAALFANAKSSLLYILLIFIAGMIAGFIVSFLLIEIRNNITMKKR